MITSLKEFRNNINILNNLTLCETSKNHYVGIHCSSYSFDNFKGKIIDEYYIHFEQILKLIQFDYPDAKILIQKIKSFNHQLSLEDDTIDLIYEIVEFFSNNNLEWIFVSNREAMTKYGDNCYQVYFKNMNHVYLMQDELTENSTIYIYNSTINKPILSI